MATTQTRAVPAEHDKDVVVQREGAARERVHQRKQRDWKLVRRPAVAARYGAPERVEPLSVVSSAELQPRIVPSALWFLVISFFLWQSRALFIVFVFGSAAVATLQRVRFQHRMRREQISIAFDAVVTVMYLATCFCLVFIAADFGRSWAFFVLLFSFSYDAGERVFRESDRSSEGIAGGVFAVVAATVFAAATASRSHPALPWLGGTATVILAPMTVTLLRRLSIKPVSAVLQVRRLDSLLLVAPVCAALFIAFR